MRGKDDRTEGLFSYVSCEARVPSTHPLRPIRAIADEALEVLSAEFESMYSRVGRPSIPPEKLLRALLLQAFYSIRSERQLMEQMDYNLLFRWFVGLSMDAQIWDATVFTKNRERLLGNDVATKFLAAVAAQARGRDLLSDDHFSVDGTLIEAWASMKSFRPKDGGDAPPDAPSGGTGRNAEREATLAMLDAIHGGKRRKTAIDGRTTRHPGYAVSLRIRKRIEEVFGWMKTVGGLTMPGVCQQTGKPRQSRRSSDDYPVTGAIFRLPRWGNGTYRRVFPQPVRLQGLPGNPAEFAARHRICGLSGRASP